MKLFAVVVLALVAAAAAAPADKDEPKVVRSELNQNADGTYTNDVELSDGTVRHEEGTLKEVVDEENKPHTVVVVRGYYKYVAPDGTPIEITYTGDETGYQAQGDAIPKAE